jgi:hypothetical protein
MFPSGMICYTRDTFSKIGGGRRGDGEGAGAGQGEGSFGDLQWLMPLKRLMAACPMGVLREGRLSQSWCRNSLASGAQPPDTADGC